MNLQLCPLTLPAITCHAGAVELRKELASLFALDLPPTLIFDYPSVEALAAALAPQLPDVVLAGSSEAQSAAVPDSSASDARDSEAESSSGCESEESEIEDSGSRRFSANSTGSLIAAFRPDEPSETGLSRHVLASLPPANPLAPTLRRPGYYTVPGIRKLRHMSNEELSAGESGEP